MWTPVVSYCLPQSKECKAASESSTVVDIKRYKLFNFIAMKIAIVICNYRVCLLSLHCHVHLVFVIEFGEFLGAGGLLLIESLPRLQFAERIR